MKVSIIIAVLDSHEVVKRQMMHFCKMDTEDCEIIIVDDGSKPAIEPYFTDGCDLRVIHTNDERPWSQPCARNRGAEAAKGEYVFMTDIDHVISQESVDAAREFTGDKMMFPRQWGVLDIAGNVIQDKDVLIDYGLAPELYEKRGLGAGGHHNTFVMRKAIYDELGGYDESFCGKYGGDDTNFSNRYGQLHRQGKCARHVRGPRIFVYPNPRKDVKKIFHKLRFK